MNSPAGDMMWYTPERRMYTILRSAKHRREMRAEQIILYRFTATLHRRPTNVEERPGLAVLRRTEMPAVLIETGFINNDYDNYLYDYNFEAIADAIANAVDETIGARA